MAGMSGRATALIPDAAASIYKRVFWLLVTDAIAWGWVGANPPVGIYVLVGRAATLYYFVHS